MGAYLDKPVTDKQTEGGTLFQKSLSGDGVNLPFVVSSMQGWRKSMEDAHISIANLENSYDVPAGTSIFAVFDGHGGKEVSAFCARHFVPTLVELESFKARAYREALIECFHKMDELLVLPRYKDELQQLAHDSPKQNWSSTPLNFQNNTFNLGNEEGDDQENETDDEMDSIGEGDIELESLPLSTPLQSGVRRDSKDSLFNEFSSAAPMSDGLYEDGAGTINLANKLVERSESLDFTRLEKVLPPTVDENPSLVRDEGTVSPPDDEGLPQSLEGVNAGTRVTSLPFDSYSKTKSGTDQTQSRESAEASTPGDILSADLSTQMEAAEQRGTVSRTEAIDMIVQMLKLSRSRAPAADSNQGPQRRFDTVAQNLPTNAGTTACVVLIIEGKIYAANAGDSRAVLCTDALSEPLSFDHKPENSIEKSRIERGGGWVTPMGRICGNLNLSRCIGDLKYKGNSELSKAEQIITAEPDVLVRDLTVEDMFLVIACDGVWDILTNEMIVDFIGKKIVEYKAQELESIVEDIFERCLCDDPMRAEGKGGDNMTCIIVCLKPLAELARFFADV